jgi:hypothetical protein
VAPKETIHGRHDQGQVDRLLGRIESHTWTPRNLVGVHHPDDTTCPWPYARAIFAAFTARRAALGATLADAYCPCAMVQTRRNGSCHDYVPHVLYCDVIWQRLLPGEAWAPLGDCGFERLRI